MTSISIIIPCGRPDRLPALAAALAAQTRLPDETLIVCADPIPALRSLTHVSVPQLYPPGRMRNLGAAAAKGDILLFLDDDCIPPPNWVAAMLATLESDARIAAVGCKLVSAKPGFWNRCADFALFWPYQYDQRHDTALGSATLAVRKTAFMQAGGFDESLLATEDWDFCLKLHTAGWRTVHDPAVTVQHDHRRGSLTAILRQSWKSGLLSGLTVQRRHGERMSWLAKLAVYLGNRWLYWLMILPLAGLVAILQIIPFVRSEPRVLLFSPVVFLGRLLYQCGVWRKLGDEMMDVHSRWRAACWSLMVLIFVAVGVTGLLDSEPMIGDEVTHYYMTVTQATELPGPNIHARIEMGNGTDEVRRYPHVFLWHYLGAYVWKYLGASFRVVECYHLLYVLQLFVALWLLVRREEGGDTGATFLYLLSVLTLPVTLLFSVALYQDIPVLAQLVTSLWLLRRGNPLMSALVMGVGLSIKVTLFPIIPAYLLLMGVQLQRSHGRRRAISFTLAAVAILVASCTPMALALKSKGAPYYPLDMTQQYIHTVKKLFQPAQPDVSVSLPQAMGSKTDPNDETEREVISAHPGDVRNPINLLIFGGGVLALVFAACIAQLGWAVSRRDKSPPVSEWALWLGLFYGVVTALHLHAAPDIRFFLPAIVLILLPVSQRVVRMKGSAYWLPLLLVGGLLQGGVVLHKAHMLRLVRPGITQAIAYLKANSPGTGELFMYPEGNYRLFPIGHEWYLGYALRDFWRADNDTRIAMLLKRDLSAIVIKKYLVGPIDPEMNNLGIYPDFFVEQIAADPRFKKLYENDDVVIYQVPGALEKDWKIRKKNRQDVKKTTVTGKASSD